MVGLLIKKEFKNLFRTYFVNQKSGKGYSKAKTLGFICLFVFLILILMAMFFGMGISISGPLVSMGLGWFYFAIMGIMALALGVFGDVFNTYAMLYKAKDNELLLTLPIPSSKILISRMVVVFLLGLLYECIVFIPGIISFWLGGGNNYCNVPSAIISQILILLFLGLFITSLTCFLGWLVALASNKMQHKNIAVIIFSVIFFGAYYFFCMRLSDFINSLILNAEAFSNNVKSAFYPAFAFGMAGVGNLMDTLIFVAFSVVTFAIAVYILSISFRKIITTNKGSVKVKYKGYTGKKSSQYFAIWKMEGKRFVSIPTYTLNAGLGIIIMPALLILLLFKKSTLAPLIEMVGTTEYAPLIPMVCATMMACIVSMDCGTAPSMSLEGKSIWILQSSPVDPKTVMRGKIDFHFFLNVIPAFILAFFGSLILGFGALDTLLIVVYTVAFTYLISAFGMMMGTIRANVNWTNPVVPIKQSMAVMITLFSGWILSVVYPGGWYLMRSFVDPIVWKVVMTLLIVIMDILSYLWCMKIGIKKIKEL